MPTDFTDQVGVCAVFFAVPDSYRDKGLKSFSATTQTKQLTNGSAELNYKVNSVRININSVMQKTHKALIFNTIKFNINKI